VAAKAAVSEWFATVKAVTGNVADPAESVTAPRTVVPSLKVTVPVTVPDPGATGLTVAVNVTDWPNSEGFTDEVSAVVVDAAFTVCVTAVEVLAAKPPLAV
jgi:hypothetical protein